MCPHPGVNRQYKRGVTRLGGLSSHPSIFPPTSASHWPSSLRSLSLWDPGAEAFLLWRWAVCDTALGTFPGSYSLLLGSDPGLVSCMYPFPLGCPTCCSFCLVHPCHRVLPRPPDSPPLSPLTTPHPEISAVTFSESLLSDTSLSSSVSVRLYVWSAAVKDRKRCICKAKRAMQEALVKQMDECYTISLSGREGALEVGQMPEALYCVWVA